MSRDLALERSKEQQRRIKAENDMTTKHTPLPWEPGKCNVPMWMMGAPSGFCLKPANGPQLPQQLLGWANRPYCHGHCCPSHGGPQEGEPIVFQDGCTDEGLPMWCAVMPDFVNLQESPAGFSGNAVQAVGNLRAAIAKATGETP